MEIEGPFTITLLRLENSATHALNIRFTASYQTLTLEERVRRMEHYIADLGRQLKGLKDEDTNKPGILAIFQFSSQLLPHIVKDEIPLSETIELEYQPSNLVNDLVLGKPVH